ncbi:MAG: hypothetical protein R2738_01750 [Bacteroides graminisolvens]
MVKTINLIIMNYLNKIFLFLFIGTMMLLASCSPDEYALGNTDVKPGDLVEGIAYRLSTMLRILILFT